MFYSIDTWLPTGTAAGEIIGTYSSSVECALVAPDSTCSLGPMHPRDAVVIPRHEPEHIVTDELVLVRGDTVDAADVKADTREQRLPPGDGMGPYDGVAGAELIVDIQGRATRGHDIVVSSLTGRLEDGLGAGGGQCLEECLEGGRQPVVELVAGHP